MKTWQKLIKNSSLWPRFLVRERVIAAIREFFSTFGFHEVEVPLLASSLPAESYIEVFETTLLNRHRQGRRAYLTTSPEMFLKKLLVAGIGNCFCITKSFRNTEDMSDLHNPEFTILEWYRVEADYKDLMKDTEELFRFIYQQINEDTFHLRTVIPVPYVIPAKAGISKERSPVKPGMTKKQDAMYQDKKLLISYKGQTIDLTPPWERVSMAEAFARYAHINLFHALKEPVMKKLAGVKGYQVSATSTWEELFQQIYLNEVVPNFPKNRPIIIYDYPVQLAALAAKKRVSDPRFAERFEVYIAGLELADCCSELTDWCEQEERYQKEAGERRRLRKIDYPFDQDFIEALKAGLPKCAGLALGVDRLVMLFANVPKIQDTLFFPAEETWGE